MVIWNFQHGRLPPSCPAVLPLDATQSAVYVTVSRLSVRPSVTLRYEFHIRWNTSKIILRPNSLRLMRWLTPTWAIWCNGNTQNYGRIELGQGAHKAVRSPKRWKIGPRLLLRTNRKSHTRFRLAPKSMTSDDLERPKRHFCRNKQISGA